MARNRRSQSATARLGPLLFALGLCSFFCVAGMGYVWHRNRNAQLSREMRVLTARLEQLRADHQLLDRKLEELRSPRVVEAAVRKWNLGLVMPHPDQILRLPEGQPGTALPPLHFARLAARAANR